MITELISGKENVLLVVNSGDLKEIVNRFVDEREAELEERKKEQSDKLLSADEAAEKLGVTRNTLWRWAAKDGILKPIGKGKKKFYRQSEIERFLNEGRE